MKNRDFEDDGRQIADMSSTQRSWYGLRMNRRKPKGKAVPESNSKPDYYQEPELTKKESRQLVANAILAALAIGVVFIGAAFLFLLFMTRVWLK